MEQRGIRALKWLFVINNSEGVPKIKTAAITVALALGLSLSGAYAQNANDRPGKVGLYLQRIYIF